MRHEELSKSEIYEKLEKASNEMQEDRDCAVKAIAVVGGLTYEDAHVLLELHGRKPKDGTPRIITEQALKFLDLKAEDCTKMFRDLGGKTVRTLGRVMKGIKGKFLVFTASHVLAVKDGEVHDWTKGRLHRVQNVKRISPIGDSNE
jgi:hypothetical protein